jgi:hypothetical protein
MDLWGFLCATSVPGRHGVRKNQGFGVFTASLILAIMIIPYATSLSNEIIMMVPNDLKEAAYSLGATRLEVITHVTIPAARSGIIAGYILSFGRALGETMAVTMLIGNANIVPTSFTSTGNTMASVIANQFGEADGLKLSSLIAIGLLLFLITGIVICHRETNYKKNGLTMNALNETDNTRSRILKDKIRTRDCYLFFAPDNLSYRIDYRETHCQRIQAAQLRGFIVENTPSTFEAMTAHQQPRNHSGRHRPTGLSGRS